MSAGELESGNAGEPAKLIRQRYREASDIIRKGKMCSLFINDLDAGAALSPLWYTKQLLWMAVYVQSVLSCCRHVLRSHRHLCSAPSSCICRKKLEAQLHH